jgi:hypothetical protein
LAPGDGTGERKENPGRPSSEEGLIKKEKGPPGEQQQKENKQKTKTETSTTKKMKKLILTIAIIAQSVLVFAGDKKEATVIRAKNDNVKLYQQAGTASATLDALQTTQSVTYIRKFNDQWSIVQVDGQVGYVLTSELVSEKVEAPVTAAKK